LPSGIEIVPVYDRSKLINGTIYGFIIDLVLAIAIVSLVICLFLRHLTSAIVPVLSIPVCLLVTGIPLYWAGVSINIFTLSGLALSVGVLADGAIIQVENVYRVIARSNGERHKLYSLTNAGSERSLSQAGSTRIGMKKGPAARTISETIVLRARLRPGPHKRERWKMLKQGVPTLIRAQCPSLLEPFPQGRKHGRAMPEAFFGLSLPRRDFEIP